MGVGIENWFQFETSEIKYLFYYSTPVYDSYIFSYNSTASCIHLKTIKQTKLSIGWRCNVRIYEDNNHAFNYVNECLSNNYNNREENFYVVDNDDDDEIFSFLFHVNEREKEYSF